MLGSINLDGYSDAEIMAAQLLANKDTNGMSNARIADEVGISDRQLYRWMNSEAFIELMEHFAELAQKAFVPEMYQQMRKAVRQGSVRALELALKNQGKLIDKKEVSGSVDVTAINGGLSEDAIRKEIEELRKKVEGSIPNRPALKEGTD